MRGKSKMCTAALIDVQIKWFSSQTWLCLFISQSKTYRGARLLSSEWQLLCNRLASQRHRHNIVQRGVRVSSPVSESIPLEVHNSISQSSLLAHYSSSCWRAHLLDVSLQRSNCSFTTSDLSSSTWRSIGLVARSTISMADQQYGSQTFFDSFSCGLQWKG